MNGAMGVPVYLLHPMVVHFPIALLVLGWLAGLAGEWQRSPAWMRPAAPWALGAGTLFLWATLGLGLVAARTAPHVPAAWDTMFDHRNLALGACTFFTLLSLWAKAWPGRGPTAFTLAWALGLGWLGAAAHLGATLVFTYGMGVNN